jgi:hypothetical protein
MGRAGPGRAGSRRPETIGRQPLLEARPARGRAPCTRPGCRLQAGTAASNGVRYVLCLAQAVTAASCAWHRV